MDEQSAPFAQVRPLAHLPHVAPPQSVSASSESLRPSAQWVATQVVVTRLHAALTQSPSAPHRLPVAQAPQSAPPQSRSVSSPLLAPSVQWSATHRLVATLHAAEAQSEAVWHAASTAQPAQPPPQSSAVSCPSSTPSRQRLATHDPEPTLQMPVAQSAPEVQPAMQVWAEAEHDPLPQSLPVAQATPTAQPVQVPPQSTAVSLPFLRPSEQPFVAHLPLAPHAAEAQSRSSTQAMPTLQPPQSAPPQSSAVSSASWVWSEQWLVTHVL